MFHQGKIDNGLTNEEEKPKPWWKKDQYLPYWFVYIGWTLIFFSVIAPGKYIKQFNKQS